MNCILEKQIIEISKGPLDIFQWVTAGSYDQCTHQLINQYSYSELTTGFTAITVLFLGFSILYLMMLDDKRNNR